MINKDGIDHINIYSKGKTELGRYLSNFTYSPFEHPIYGNFKSIEGFWYYNLTGDEKLRELYGYEAKKHGQNQCKYVINGEWGVDRTQVKLAIIAKLTQSNPEMLEEFIYSDLPFKHYYNFGGKIIEPKEAQWLVNFFINLREQLQYD